MSTRCNIIIKDSNTKLYFYRHSDGYPECTGKDLKEFVKGYKTNMRDNPGQSAGWLILRGRESMLEYHAEFALKYKSPIRGYDWKVGHYEPTDSIHGDIEFLYVIDLENKTLTCHDGQSEDDKTVFVERFEA